MRKLFLSSYFSEVASLFAAFAENTCPGKNVVFIPTASKHEEVTFYVDEDKKTLEGLGMTVVELDVSSAPYEEIAAKISGADYVFIEGGNVFFLLQELRRSRADKLIIEHISRGKPYIGASAGSVIVSEDVGYVKDMDEPDAAPDLNGDFSALAIVDFCIVPHYTDFPFQEIAGKIVKEYSGKLDLCPISNNQAVVVDGDTVTTIAV